MRTSNKKRVKATQSSGKLDWRYFLVFILGFSLALVIQTLSGNSEKQDKSVGGGSPGGWQNWEYATIKLQRPEDTLPPVDVKPPEILWLFKGYSPDGVEKLIKSCNLDEILEKNLLDKSRWRIEPVGVIISPTSQTVKDLPLEARKTIYSVLRQFSENFFHFNPFRLSVDELDKWLAESGLTPENQLLFRKVSWREGDTVLFYDYQLLEYVSNPQEKRRVARALSQIPSLLMNLKITSQTDVEAVVKYFENGGRGREMKSFLESLAKLPDGRSVSVSFFLPSFARLRLYTYPRVEPGKKNPDCFWSAMNFFNEVPDDRFHDPQYIQQVLQTEYSMIKTNYTFGDLLLLLEGEDKAIHMCVYIADDVVFTKNGAQDLQPWILMKLPDMLKIYQSDKPMRILAYRRKR
ncbi:MAG: hypothetical protein N2487_02910 [Verrucomicrobiae bacterium]|nr:hypothetical protein [Verrucomicrobiae bacterium]